MTETTPQCPEALYTPETDTLRRCTQSGPHDWHEDEHGTKWRDPMADQDSLHLDPFSDNPADVRPRPLTPERLAEMREREQAATKGPWGTYYDGKGTYTVQFGCRVSLASGFTSEGDIATLHGEHGDGQTYANADFMARAPEDVRDLLAEVERLRAERDRYRNAWHNARTRAADGYSDADWAEQSRERWRGAARKAEGERDELKKRFQDAGGTR